LYRYNLESGTTINLTEGLMGYDTQPVFFSAQGYAGMAQHENATDTNPTKNDILIRQGSSVIKPHPGIGMGR